MNIVNKKKELIIIPIIITILGVGIHYASTYINNEFLKMLFLSKETYFDHLKLYFTSFLILYMGEYFTNTKSTNNYLLSRVVSMLVMMVTTLIGSYLILYLLFDGVNTIAALSLYVVSIFVGQFVATYIQKYDIHNNNIIAIIIQIMITLFIAYFTYFPIANSVFFKTFS